MEKHYLERRVWIWISFLFSCAQLLIIIHDKLVMRRKIKNYDGRKKEEGKESIPFFNSIVSFLEEKYK